MSMPFLRLDPGAGSAAPLDLSGGGQGSAPVQLSGSLVQGERRFEPPTKSGTRLNRDPLVWANETSATKVDD